MLKYVDNVQIFSCMIAYVRLLRSDSLVFRYIDTPFMTDYIIGTSSLSLTLNYNPVCLHAAGK